MKPSLDASVAARVRCAKVETIHDDFEIACDNTRTCRAAGYSEDSAELKVSAQVPLGHDDDDTKGLPSSVRMTIDGRPIATVKLERQTATATAGSPAEASPDA